MPEVLIPRYPINARDTELICSAPNTILRDGLNRQPTMLQANMPYLVGNQVSPGDLGVLSALSAADATTHLSQMSVEFGSDGVLAMERLQSHLTAILGSGGSVYGERVGQLNRYVEAYEKALLAYREVTRTGSPL